MIRKNRTSTNSFHLIPKIPSFFSSLLIYLLFFGISGCSDESPEPEFKTINDSEAKETAREIRHNLSANIADGLEISLWASEALLGDPIAIHMDHFGRALVTVTHRSRNSEFDIRDVHSSWLQETIKFKSVEDRREFLHRELTPERSEENTFVPDHNNDGLHDWRDLTVMKEEVWRVEDLTGNGMANQAQLFIRDFNDETNDVAGAIVYHDEQVFLGVGPDMWRIRDTDEDGMGDWKESISHGYNVHIGFSGHGMSGATVGPAGRIYWGIGDMGLNKVDQDGNKWYYPNQGVIVRSDPDGSNFEVFAAGLRNTHEFTFDKYGNLISVDNDGDHAGEHERLVYLVNGSDSGWRTNWQFGKYTDPKNNLYKVWMDEEYFKPRWENQAAHILPPLAPYHSGPAGMAYNPGTALSEEWNDHFFVMSFRGSTANSAIFGFTLQEKGASFELETDQEVMQGVLAVGLDFGPDGALYMTDWVEGWSINNQGRIWKLDASGEASSAVRTETKTLLAGDFSGSSESRLAELLHHQDMRVRQKAQFELAGRNATDLFASTAEAGSPRLARIHSIWGLAQIGRRTPQAVEPLTGLLGDEDPEIRGQAAKMLGDVRYRPAAEQLLALLTDESLRVQFFATEALGRMEYRPAFEEIVAMLEANNDEDVYLRHGGAIALARINDPEATTALAGHPSRAVRVAGVVALKRMQHPGVARFLQDSDEYIVTNAARAISDDGYIGEALPALARLLDQTRFVNGPLMRRAINAALYSGTENDARRLAGFAARGGVADSLRREALRTLAGWGGSSEFDRVTGRYRGAVDHDPDPARRALQQELTGLLGDESHAVTIAALQAIGQLNLSSAAAEVFDLFRGDSSPGVQMAALNSLQTLQFDRIQDAVELALEDPDRQVRMAALGMLPELGFPEETTAGLLAAAFEEGSIVEQQTVLKTMGAMETGAVHEFLQQQLERLLAGELPGEIQLDLILAVEQTDSTPFENRLAEYRASKGDEMLAKYRESLKGGDAENGRRIFYRHTGAQCIRCHVVDGQGGAAGPELTGIGERLSREELLEAMVEPNARIAPGFGVVTAVLENGETIRGVLREETQTTLTIESGDTKRTLQKTELSQRTNTPSSMPAMGDILTRKELRDLVEYLKNLKHEQNIESYPGE